MDKITIMKGLEADTNFLENGEDRKKISPMFLDTITQLSATICEVELSFITRIKNNKRTILAIHGTLKKNVPVTNLELFFNQVLAFKVLELGDLLQNNHKYDIISLQNDFRFCAAIAFETLQGITTLEIFGKMPKTLNNEQKNHLINSIKILEKEVSKSEYITELERKNKHYENFFLHNLDILVTININGRITKANQQWSEIMGYGQEETLETAFLDYIHPDDYPSTLPLITKVFKQKKVFNFEIRFKNKIGNYRILEWRAYSDGEEIFASARDITEKQKKENEIQRLTNLLTNAQEIASLGAWELELDSGKITWTEEVYKIHELALDFNQTLENAIEFYHPDDRAIMKQALENTAKTGEPFDLTCRLITANQNLRWVKSLGRLTKYHSQSDRIVGIFQDITQKTIEEQGKEYYALLLKGLFERSPIGIALVDLKTGLFLDVNQKLVDPTGYTVEKFKELHFWDLMLPKDAEEQKNILKNLDPHQYYGPKELEYLKSDDTHYHVLISGVILTDGYGNQKFWTFIEDISQRKLYEIQIKESLSRLQGIMDASTQVCIISTDNAGIIQNFNRGAELLFGYAANEMIHLNSIDVLEPQEINVSNNGNNLNNESIVSNENTSFYSINKLKNHQSGEWTLRKKNGVKVPVYLNVTSIKQGHDNSGFLLIANDISPIKKANEKLRFLLDLSKDQNERLKNFANIVSHNLKSHSGNIDTLIQFLLDDQPSLRDQELVKMIKLASDNLKETISHLSEVALVNSAENQKQEKIYLFETANKAIDSVQALAIKETIQIYNEIEKDSSIMGIPAYVDSIILNFLTNGIKYRAEDRASYIKLFLNKTNGYQVLHIQDNGLGIDLDKYGSKLFGLYKTFHRKKDSQGIGLFITKNQVESMGGFIQVESEVNKGTTFKIYFKDQKATAMPHNV